MFYNKRRNQESPAIEAEQETPEVSAVPAAAQAEIAEAEGLIEEQEAKPSGKVRQMLSAACKPVQNLYRRVRRAQEWCDRYPLIQLFVTAFFVTLVVEMLQRNSVIGALQFLVTAPLAFLCCWMIVAFTTSFSLLFRKRRFARILLSFFWLLLGLVDCIMFAFRTTPLAAIDFELMSSVSSIISVYLSTWQLVLCVILFVLVVILFVIMLIKTKKQKVNWLRAAIGIIGSGVLMAVSVFGGLRIGALSNQFPNLPIAYRSYGFVYCFTSSAIDRGVTKPSNYSTASISEILEAINQTENNMMAGSAANEDHPNVIFIQLESFFDVNYLSGVTYTQNPVPHYTELKENFISGYLNVPSFGAGTANVEFEVLSGMRLDDFGTGEYPYKTILQDHTCETIAYNLKELGYTTHAIHNHYATFYDRNLVFSHLGFDTFTSLEFLNNISYTPRGWCTDLCLDTAIFDALKSTENQDFVFAISVQGHGQYPAHKTYGLEGVAVRSGIEDEEMANAFTYYLRMIHQTDAFVGNLIAQLEEYDEPTVVVLYGDHLPTFDFLTNETLENGDIYATEYVIWSNIGLTDESATMYSYQLAAYVMDLLDFNNGVITKLHQNYQSNVNYRTALEMLEYDMLYGEGTAYQGETPKATTLRLGVNPISVTNVTNFRNETLFVHGEGFTRYATVCIDGKTQETEFISEQLLKVELDDPLSGNCELTLQYAGKDKDVLITSAPYYLQINGEEMGTDAQGDEPADSEELPDEADVPDPSGVVSDPNTAPEDASVPEDPTTAEEPPEENGQKPALEP